VVVVEPNRNNPIMLLRVLFMKVEFRALAFSLGHVRRMAQRAGLSIEDAFSYGMLIPVLTPEIFLSLAELGNFRQPFGWDNFVIAYKDG
jgi:hypothetical protein